MSELGPFEYCPIFSSDEDLDRNRQSRCNPLNLCSPFVRADSGSGTDDSLHGLTNSGDAATTATAAAVSTGGPDDMLGGMNMSGSTGGTTSSTTTATVLTTSGVPIEISSAAVTEQDDYRVVSTSGPSGDLSGLLGVTNTIAAATSGLTTQMSDQSIFGLNSGSNQPSTRVGSSPGGSGLVNAASMTSLQGLRGGGMAEGITGMVVHHPPVFGAYAYPGSAGGGAAAMMGAAGIGGQQAWHQTGGMAHHHYHQVPGYGQPGMMIGRMMDTSPAMGRMSMMTQPPVAHSLFSGGGSMGGVTAAGSTGMSSYAMGSGSSMGGSDPSETRLDIETEEDRVIVSEMMNDHRSSKKRNHSEMTDVDESPNEEDTKEPEVKKPKTILNTWLKMGDIEFKVINMGSGHGTVKKGDTVSVKYVSQLENGKEIEKYMRDARIFTVGEGDVLSGLELGVLGMKRSSKRILKIPSTLGYSYLQSNSYITVTVKMIDWF